MPKESTPSVDLFSRGWVICPLPEQNSKSQALPSLSVARDAKGSKKSCWRKPQTHSRKRHDGCDHHYHCLLLDHFVLLQRNRKWPVVDRSGPIAAKCEASRARGFAIESPAPTPRTVIGDRSAHHECRRHRRSASADKPVVSVVRLHWILIRPGHCASCLSIRVVGSPQIIVPPISISRAGATCRRARIHVNFLFAAPGARRAIGQATPARSRRETRPPFCRARGTQTDHNR